ncbi:hypothetical protein Taro_022879 [Colocasia esculenta]|uniref:Uncharacterized protein n=1 Tax=Colocasia esculenta TaxID=4460 RepID=A0A843VFQ8_COLES|nr:hypothetical protein [Colocasia esculenta]
MSPTASKPSHHLSGARVDQGEGFPDPNLLWRSTENQEEGSFGDFLGLPKESFINIFDPFEDLFRGKYPIHFVHILNRVLDLPFYPVFGARSVLLHRQELGVNALTAKISSLCPAILPSNPLNGQRLPLSSLGQNNELFFLVQTFYAKDVSTHPSMVSTHQHRLKEKLCKNVDTLPGQVDTRPSSQNSQFEELGQQVDTLPGQVDTRPSSQNSQFEELGQQVDTLKSRSTRDLSPRTDSSIFGTKPLKHLKEVDQVEAIVGEEFKEGPTSQIAEHRLGLHVYKLLPNSSFYKGVHLKNESRSRVRFPGVPLGGRLLGGMLRGRCACQRLTLGRPENEGVAEVGLAKSCLGPGVDLPAGVAVLSSRGTVPCGGL